MRTFSNGRYFLFPKGYCAIICALVLSLNLGDFILSDTVVVVVVVVVYSTYDNISAIKRED